MNQVSILTASIKLRETIGNSYWMELNKAAILKPIPTEWTSANKVQLQFGFALKVLGVNWSTTDDLVIAFMYLESLGLVESWTKSDNTKSIVVRRVIEQPV